MASSAKTVIVIAIAAAVVIGAGLYFAPKTTTSNAAGAVAPAERHKGESTQGASGQPTSPSPSAGQQGTTMQSSTQGAPGKSPANSDRQREIPFNAPKQEAASDRRLKSNIVRIGTHPLGIGLYEYDIFGERQRGVMADEVEQIMPEAVTTHPTLGYRMVRYDLLNQPKVPPLK